MPHAQYFVGACGMCVPACFVVSLFRVYLVSDYGEDIWYIQVDKSTSNKLNLIAGGEV